MRGFVEPLAQIRPQGVAHRFNRVQRLVFEYLGKYVAHQVIVIVRRNNGGTKPVGRLNAIVISAAGAYQNSPAPDIRPPLSESEKPISDLRLIALNHDGRIGSLAGWYPIISARNRAGKQGQLRTIAAGAVTRRRLSSAE
jgi:hypothetical protein